MKEKVFRIYNKKNKNFIYSYDFDNLREYFEAIEELNLDERDIGQYIGTKDCDDNLVFEGDIVGVYRNITRNIDLCIVKMENGSVYPLELFPCKNTLDKLKIRIMDNIYENKKMY